MISQRNGRIVNIASLRALLRSSRPDTLRPPRWRGALTQSLAKEVARMAYTVKASCPGYWHMKREVLWSDEDRKAAQRRIPCVGWPAAGAPQQSVSGLR